MAGSGRSVLNMIFGPGSGPAPLVRRKSLVARNNSRPPEANKAMGILWKKEVRDVSSTPHSFVVLTQWSIVNIS